MPPAGDSSGESRHGENISAETSLLKLPSIWRIWPSSSPATIRARAAIAGKKRLSVPVPSTTPAVRQAAVARSASARVRAKGFSQNTAFLAAAQATISSACRECGVASTIAAMRGRASASSRLPRRCSRCRAANPPSREGSRLTAVVKRRCSLLPCTDSTRVRPQRPKPTIAASIIGATRSTIRVARLAALRDDQPVARGFLEGLGRRDLDAEPGEPDIGPRARRIEPDRGDIEIAQDLGAEPDIFPLPVALQFGGGAVLGDRGRRDARGAVAQVDQDAAAGSLEAAQRGMDRL